MMLSIIIPCYNEKDTILEVINRIEKVPIEKEIIIVDDGSQDVSKEILGKLKEKNPGIKIIFNAKNMGKGEAVKIGLRYAEGDYVIIQDADLEYFPEDYPKLLKPIMEGRSEVVFGSRLLEKTNPKGSILYYLGRYSINWVVNILFGVHLTDSYTCYKVFPTKLLKSFNIESKSFELEAELTAKTILKGITIYEVPIRYKPRSVMEGKKINWRDWIKGAWTYTKYRIKGKRSFNHEKEKKQED